MAATTVLRFAKKHAWSQITQSANHNSRRNDPENVDKSRSHLNRFLIGRPNDNVVELCKARISTDRKIRSDAVLGVVGIMSAGPAYFRPSNPYNAGTFEANRLEPWVKASMNWLKKTYGDRIIQAVLHLDEVTPHIHFILLPLDHKGHLNCKALLGGHSKRLSMIQSDYHKSVQHLGIERGLEGSTAKHQKVKQVYSVMTNTAKPALPEPDEFISEPPGWLYRSEGNIKAYAAKVLEAQREADQNILDGLAAKAALAERQAEELKKMNIRLKAESEKMEVDKAQLAEVLEDFRIQAKQMTAALSDLDLAMVLKDMFEAQRQGLDGFGRELYKLPKGEAVYFKGPVWQTTRSKGKGAIHLVMDLAGYSQSEFQQAIRDLAEVYGDEATGQALAGYMAEAAHHQVKLICKDLLPTQIAYKAVERRYVATEDETQAKNDDKSPVEWNRPRM